MMKNVILFLGVNRKRVQYKLVILVLFLLMATLISRGIVAYVENLYGQDAVRLKIAIVNEDDKEDTQHILNLVMNSNRMTDLFDVCLTSSGEAQTLLENKEISAMITLPEGFLYSILYGENLSPEIMIKESNVIEHYIISNITTSFSNMIMETQDLIYITYDYLNSNGYDSEELALTINMDYIKTVLNYEDMFEQQELKYVNSLDISKHYTICISLFILFLMTPLFYDEICINKNKSFFTLMRSRTNSYLLFYYSMIFIIAVVYFMVLWLLATYLQAELTLPFLMFLFHCALYMILLQSVFMNVWKDYVITVFVNFSIHLFFFIVSGGIIPTIFLPQYIAKLEIVSPISIIKTILSLGFLNVSNGSNIPVVLVNVILVICLTYMLQNKTKVM
ncbi:MAG: ABC transporter permease [Eubacteriales bacterium]